VDPARQPYGQQSGNPMLRTSGHDLPRWDDQAGKCPWRSVPQGPAVASRTIERIQRGRVRNQNHSRPKKLSDSAGELGVVVLVTSPGCTW
jgi:hypothetical protein